MKRIDQILANLGYCPRSKAEEWIAMGRVTLKSGALPSPFLKIDPEDLRIDGESLDCAQGIFVMLHKPTGYVCTHSSAEGPTIYDFLPSRWLQRNPKPVSIGRLDKNTSGLLLITDQTQLVHRMTSPKHKIPKVYRATIDRDFPQKIVDIFASGTLTLKDEEDPCLPVQLQILGAREAELTLIEGKYHQIRRMFAATGCEVLTLHRLRVGHYELGELAPGQYRHLEIPKEYPSYGRGWTGFTSVTGVEN